MKTFLTQVVLAVLIFVAGIIVGYTERGQSQLKTEVKAEHTAAQQTATGVAKAQVVSQRVDTTVAGQTIVIAQNKTAIHKRVVKQIQQHIAAESNPTETHNATPQDPVCGSYFLDVGTVRMLNATRQGTAIHATSSGDEAGDAAPALCYSEFVDADVELTRIYLDLSVRHDALVDSVEGYQAEQRARLGIKDEPAAAPEPIVATSE